MAILIAILGGTAIFTMPVDIFPYIDIPIVSVLGLKVDPVSLVKKSSEIPANTTSGR